MAADNGELVVFVGCYTTPDRGGRGEGITAYRVDGATGAWQPLGLVARTDNPSFLALHPNGRIVYAVHGGNLSDVSAYSIGDPADGGLTHLGSTPSGGTNPVHLDLDHSGRWLVVANYTGANIAILPVQADGTLGAINQLVPLVGACGPDPVQQASPHPHDIPFDRSGAFVMVPDKGLDRVFVFRIDTEHGRFVNADPPSLPSAAGAGPRHAAFHPVRNLAYVVNELNSTITAYSYASGGDGLQELQTISSLPVDPGVRSTGAEIVVHPDGRFVYVSNRGHDSVGAFRVTDAGTLQPVDWFPTQGKTPRTIAIDPSGRFLYAANQASDSIVGFRINAADGTLEPTGHTVATGSPSALVFLLATGLGVLTD